MEKIANAQELLEALRQVTAYASTQNPSRQKLAESLRSLADRVAEGSSKTASNTGYEVLVSILDRRKFEDVVERLSSEDEQSFELFQEASERLMKELSISAGAAEALSRMQSIVENGHSWRIDLLRNNVFKMANSLGINLPSGMF